MHIYAHALIEFYKTHQNKATSIKKLYVSSCELFTIQYIYLNCVQCSLKKFKTFQVVNVGYRQRVTAGTRIIPRSHFAWQLGKQLCIVICQCFFVLPSSSFDSNGWILKKFQFSPFGKKFKVLFYVRNYYKRIF